MKNDEFFAERRKERKEEKERELGQLKRIADALEGLESLLSGTNQAGSIRESLWMIANRK